MPFVDPLTIHNPTPLTPVSSAWGDQVRDDVVWLAGDGTTANPKPMCRTNAAAVGVGDTTWTALTAGSEDFDVGGMHSTTFQTARITIPAGGAGVYEFVASVGWAVSAGGTGRLLRIRKNGTTNLTAEIWSPPSGSHVVGQCVSGQAKLVAGDYIEAQGYQDSGGFITLALAEFSARWVGVG